ncbi:MAG TPA: TetR/AcrR family transcriptional regulator [Acidimicrobiales bacterium]|nr:TetR/AcrR family transcriptional regulator [Acidimicrobiales bacterium]
MDGGAPRAAHPVGTRATNGRMQKGETPKERGEQTRARIADALLGLIAERELPPTAKEVAAVAGVSVRLVFHHFEDMDALYGVVAQLQIQRHWVSVRPIAGDLPLDERISRTVAQRAKLFDTVSPVRRKAVSLASRHPDIAEGLELSNSMLRAWIEETFATELRAASRGRRELLAGLDAAGSWETWERLRNVQGLPAAAARRVVGRTMQALLAA